MAANELMNGYAMAANDLLPLHIKFSTLAHQQKPLNIEHDDLEISVELLTKYTVVSVLSCSSIQGVFLAFSCFSQNCL